MARIPITQIPNAPQLTQPVLTPTGAPRVNLMGAAQKLQQQTMALDAFSGEAKGMEALGEAGHRVSAVLEDFSLRMARAHDVVATSKAEKSLEESYGSLQEEMSRTPFDQWEGLLKTRLPEWKEQMNGIAMSSEARTSMEAYYNQFTGRIAVDVRTRANAAFIEDGRQTLVANVERRVRQQDHAGARQALRTGVEIGVISNSEAAAKDEQIARNEADISVMKWISGNPHEAARLLKSESSGFFHLNENPRLKSHYEEIANRKVFELNEGVTNTLEQAINSGELYDEAKVRSLATQARLPEEETQSLINSLKLSAPTSPEGRAIYLSQQSNLLTSIQKYDPALDSDMSGYRMLRRQLREQILPADRGTYLEELNKIVTQGSSTTNRARAGMYERVDFLTQQTLRGNLQHPGETMDFEREQEAWWKALQLKKSADQYLKTNANPTPDEISSWLNTHTNETIIMLGARDAGNPMWPGSGTWNTVPAPIPSKTPTPSKQGHPFGSSSHQELTPEEASKRINQLR